MGTIAAIATARGEAALSVVRVSGSDAIRIADRVFVGRMDLRNAEANAALFGRIRASEPETRIVDQVVATIFRAPRSSTGEDVVELSCHGGWTAPDHVLRALLSEGARLAEPGEFTRRAFLNGKLDLVQAEAVADLIHAGSRRAHEVAVRQLEGRFSSLLGELRSELLEVAGLVELELDFAEEDVAFADRTRLLALLDRSQSVITSLVASSRAGDWVRDGVRVVIGGRPNAGKSTLMNALVGTDRVIVSAEPGTTRDAVESSLDLDGLLVRLVDTAGLRETEGLVEAEGVRRAGSQMFNADIVLYLFDVSSGLADEERAFLDELITAHGEDRVICVANKADLVAGRTLDRAAGVIMVSAARALTDASVLEPLLGRLRIVLGAAMRNQDGNPVVVNARHSQHLKRALQAVVRATTGLNTGLGVELLSRDLREALDELGSITGEITNEDILGEIFSRFCIGK